MYMDDKLKYATKREIEAYEYRQKNMTYKAIGELMGITGSGARSLVRSAERRIRAFERHCDIHKKEMEKFAQPIEFSLSYGDGKLIFDLLCNSLTNYEKEFKIRNDFTNPYREANKSKLPYEYFLMKELYERLADTLDIPKYSR